MTQIPNEKIENLHVELRREYNLSRSSYFQTGPKLNYAFFPSSVDEFIETYLILNDLNLNFQVFGATSNCIFKDDSSLRIAIFTRKIKNIKILNNSIEVDSGVMLPGFCNKMAKGSYAGFEELQGIPGSIGGAIYMNAGCFGNEISRHLISVKVLKKNGSVEIIKKEDCRFGYRNSVFHSKDFLILSATFEKIIGDKKFLTKRISDLHIYRHNILEYDYRNVGSVFVTHDIYADLAKQSKLFKYCIFFLRVFFYRIFRIKNNRILNFLAVKIFHLEKFKKIFSIKTMNVLINSGQDTKLIEEYINRISRLTGNRSEIELY